MITQADPIHDALVRLGEAVSQYAESWNDASLIERTNARAALREAAAALLIATSADDEPSA